MLHCPLCKAKDPKRYHHDGQRSYKHCHTCDMVFVPDEFLLTQTQEKKTYDCHENDPDDVGYRNHLEKLSKPLDQKLKPQSTGLDYGSGPGPTLSLILEEKGHIMKVYDPFYANDKQLLATPENYDFITLTEVIEHIYQPQKDLDTIWQALKPNGLMAIMTGFNQSQGEDKQFFINWHYKIDPTHVRFYSKQTFIWLANHLNAEVSFPCENVAFLKKQT